MLFRSEATQNGKKQEPATREGQTTGDRGTQSLRIRPWQDSLATGVDKVIGRELAVDPHVTNRWFCALFVAIFGVLALAAGMASFGATADGEHILAVVFTVLTAITVHMVWTAYDTFQGMR